MKVLLTGSKGQLGSCFRDRLPSGWDLLATDSESLDISDLARVKQVVADYRPDVIVNAAAYTAVDKAESDGSWRRGSMNRGRAIWHWQRRRTAVG